VTNVRDIPAGDYWAQAFVNVYTRFARADGHTGLAAHGSVGRTELEAIARQHRGRAGAASTFDPASTTPIALVADKDHSAADAPSPDTDTVKHIKIQSQILSKWWGRPIYPWRDRAVAGWYDTHRE
jgi:hypothetical protein